MDPSDQENSAPAATCDDGSFEQVLNGTTALKEDGKVLEALVSKKKAIDASVHERVARVKSQALEVIEAATSLLNRLSLLDGSERLVLSRLEDPDKGAEAGSTDVPSRFASCTHTVATLMQQMDDKSQPFGDLTRSIRYVWTVRLVEDAATSHFYDTYCSHEFVAWGYMAKIRLDRRYGSLSVYFVLCPGPNDSVLTWPFRKVFTLTLVHPTDSSRDLYCRCVPMDTTDGIEPFKMPRGRPNVGCGSSSLCTVQFVKDNGFLVSDRFCISAEVLK